MILQLSSHDDDIAAGLTVNFCIAGSLGSLLYIISLSAIGDSFAIVLVVSRLYEVTSPCTPAISSKPSASVTKTTYIEVLYRLYRCLVTTRKQS